MILTGSSLCLPSAATVQELFSVARDASIVPDISLDPVLDSFLSLDSSAALQHQYASLQRGFSGEQQAAFGLRLTGELGGSRVSCGGVGVVALALSLLFDQVAQQVRAHGSADGEASAQRSQVKNIFGISRSSRIGWIIHRFLNLVPRVANDQEKMAETTEHHDNWLKLELIDHYERMTKKKRMSSAAMQQWLAGAAVHLHMRIHQVRLHSVPLGSAESLRFSYKSALSHLVQGYTSYLHRNIQETPASRKPRARIVSRPENINISCSSIHISNNSLVNFNDTGTPNITAGNRRRCKANTPSGDFGSKVTNRSKVTVGVNRETLNDSIGYEDVQGLLVIEPWRNVSHDVQHHPCKSPAIQQALVMRIINAQDLERNRNFFLYQEKVLLSFLRQSDDFELKTN
ncbi:putative ubiquitin carboxyl-terminal hydrolase 3 [Dissostichus eleginoides]|uniref:Ubiquitin carboxyl-terminal hydrolase 3 n=1 Tax=Dissostichus eleginoides TaxID=100907 RepID=A0AAD9BGF2_DISEL|nr:putative ubiquitin carboxyl-terminal hydrolase 3 [Dissostichus eleginoides]